MKIAKLIAPLVALIALAACSHAPAAPDFTLSDQRGHSWSLAGQRGRLVLLDFGFTHCPDTCPATVAKLAKVTGAPGAPPAVIAFVTVDPQRDDARAMRAFVGRFDAGDRLVGLTGTPAQIDAVERAYHVWAQRLPAKKGSRDYDIAHTATIYLIDGSAHLRRYLDADASQAAIASAMREAR